MTLRYFTIGIWFLLIVKHGNNLLTNGMSYYSLSFVVVGILTIAYMVYKILKDR